MSSSSPGLSGAARRSAPSPVSGLPAATAVPSPSLALRTGAPQLGWEAFAVRFAPALHRSARRALHQLGYPDGPDGPAGVEDLIQDSFCRLLEGGDERIGSLSRRTEGQVVAYLNRLVFSVAVDRWRAGAAGKRSGRRGLPASHADLGEWMADACPDPETRLLAAERLRRLLGVALAANRDRRERRRNLVILRWAWVDGWSSREISGLLAGSISPSSIDTLLCRVRRRLEQEGVSVRRRPSGPGGRL
jgi:hypothetical protein